MKYILKKLDFNILNLAAWGTLLLAYFSSGRYIRLTETGMGFPFEFITLYDLSTVKDPVDTMVVHWGYFVLNIVLMYSLIYCTNKLYKYVQGNGGHVILKVVRASQITLNNRNKNNTGINMISSTDEVVSVQYSNISIEK